MNRAARWDYLELYDKAQINGTEARAFAGNFLFSTGANENAGRYTAGHFDLPMRGCTVALDGRVVVAAGAAPGRPGIARTNRVRPQTAGRFKTPATLETPFLHDLGADALAQQRQHVVGLGVAADHLLEEDALAVHVDVEDAAGAGNQLERDQDRRPALQDARRQTGGVRGGTSGHAVFDAHPVGRPHRHPGIVPPPRFGPRAANAGKSCRGPIANATVPRMAAVTAMRWKGLAGV